MELITDRPMSTGFSRRTRRQSSSSSSAVAGEGARLLKRLKKTVATRYPARVSADSKYRTPNALTL